MADRFFCMGQVFIANGTGVITEVGRHVADVTLHVTTQGNFVFTMANGTSCVITDVGDGAAITGSPKTLTAGANAVTITGTGTITLDITIGADANWNDVNSWSDATGGAVTASVPTSTEDALFDANSFTAASQVVTVDATASCLDMDWTGATNTPTFAGTFRVDVYGSLTYITGMTRTHTGGFYFKDTVGGRTLTNAGRNFGGNLDFQGVGITLQDAVATTGGNAMGQAYGSLDTNGQTLTCGTFVIYGTGAKTLTLGASIINCTSWNYSGSNLTLTANTATINVTGTGALAGGNIDYNGSDFNLNGTAHTVSGSFTCATLTRNGTATKTDSVTFTSGDTVNCTTFAMIGNSATNRLLVQSSTLGTAATITATNWTGADNFDLMDITATNAVDLSGVSSGDCGGNTGITFTATAAQTWDGTTGSWSTAAKWTSRVPLPQDDVSAGGAGNTITVDMPRIGRSITFTGTPTVSLSNNIENYGSSTLAAGMTYTHNNKYNYFRGRGAYTLTTDGISIYALGFYAPSGSITLQDSLTVTRAFSSNVILIEAGTFNSNDQSITSTTLSFGIGSLTRVINLGASTVILNDTAALNKLYVSPTGLTFNAGTSTIVMTNSGANAQSFVGAGLTYNNVTIAGAGNYAMTITGSNTFNILTIDASVASKTVTFTDGSTQIVGDMRRDFLSNVITFQGSGAAGWAITRKGNRGISSLDYMSISRSTALPINSFYAGAHSTDGGNNSGWQFIFPPTALFALPPYNIPMQKTGRGITI